ATTGIARPSTSHASRRSEGAVNFTCLSDTAVNGTDCPATTSDSRRARFFPLRMTSLPGTIDPTDVTATTVSAGGRGTRQSVGELHAAVWSAIHSAAIADAFLIVTPVSSESVIRTVDPRSPCLPVPSRAGGAPGRDRPGCALVTAQYRPVRVSGLEVSPRRMAGGSGRAIRAGVYGEGAAGRDGA